MSIIPLTPDQFRRRVPELVAIYIRAMQYRPEISASRQSAWLSHSRLQAFSAVAALEHPEQDPPDPANFSHPVRGFCYGYYGGHGQWWNTQVRTALARADVPLPIRDELLTNYTELTEIHVDPVAQGHGLGEAILLRFAENLTTDRLLLSTPEVAGERNRAFALYRRLGFSDVVRGMYFPGDDRPFAILGSSLPLHPGKTGPLLPTA